ncbi:MAG: alpha-keto acid decarboxylase family protein, partial [Planctomycetia bacterium]|nr:alpha-keto acid decarboxylase family protein [Planctomycetia bacterium]
MNRRPAEQGLSIGAYLIHRLADYGIGHVFGLPGDYVLAFYSMLEHSPLELISCTREDCAGFAADAYARVHGMGAVCVTYGVGGLSLANSIAGAYAEQSPVVVISGATGLKERGNNPLLHHRVRGWNTQLEVFDKLCAVSLEL